MIKRTMLLLSFSFLVHVKHKDIKLQDQRPAMEWVSDVLCPLVAMSRKHLVFVKPINCYIGVCVRRVHMKVSRRRMLLMPT